MPGDQAGGADGGRTGAGAGPRVNWLFVGAGNMASALVGGLLDAGTDARGISLVDTDAAARERAGAAFGCTVHASIAGALDDLVDDGGETRTGIVLAVKPDGVHAACTALAAHAAWRAAPVTRPFVISIAAGVRIVAMADALDAATVDAPTAIVRAMPNTPSLVGRGATGVFANAACDDGVRRAAMSLFASVGIAVALDDESLVDAVTAVSGSGPAYAFALMEHMAAAGTALGLDADVAARLAIATVAGAGEMATRSDVSPATLRARVTSKGGTTAAALASFAHDDLAGAVERAARAAHRRAVELGEA